MIWFLLTTFKCFLLQHNIDLDHDTEIVPDILRCSIDRMEDSGVYLLGRFLSLCYQSVPFLCVINKSFRWKRQFKCLYFCFIFPVNLRWFHIYNLLKLHITVVTSTVWHVSKIMKWMENAFEEIIRKMYDHSFAYLVPAKRMFSVEFDLFMGIETWHNESNMRPLNYVQWWCEPEMYYAKALFPVSFLTITPSLLENGISMFIWVGLQTSPDILQQLFHANTIGQVDIEMVRYLFRVFRAIKTKFSC